MGRWLLSVLAAGIAAAGCSCVSDSFAPARERALREFDRKNYGQAFREFAELGFTGDALSCHYLGVMYRDGLYVGKDDEKAFLCFLKAAEKGVAVSQHQLALCFLDGIGVGKDPAAFFEWTARAAGQEEPEAVANLAICYWNGFQVEKNPAKGMELLSRAARLGSHSARNRLAVCYLGGFGTGTDWDAAVELLEESAAAGDPGGEYLLGAIRCAFPEYAPAGKASGLDLLAGASRRRHPLAPVFSSVVLRSRGNTELADGLLRYVRDEKLLSPEELKFREVAFAGLWKRLGEDSFRTPAEKRDFFFREGRFGEPDPVPAR